jgi:hypothetical protein
MTLSRREFSILLASSFAALRAAPSHAGPLRVRRDINTLTATELATYRAGVAAMKALPLADPKNFLWQSYVHGVDPPWVTGIPQIDYDTYFNQCNHGTHFLSWHRWYTLFWEEIVRQLCGVNAFNMPYWDSVGDQGYLPAAVRVPAKESNSLYDDSRNNALNAGTAAISGLVNDALLKAPFAAFSGGEGSINAMPHGRVHNQMGGHMQFFGESAQDPIFFLHHCNIDRYWECWLGLARRGHVNPGAPYTEQTFLFNTFSGPQTVLVGDGMRAADLGYSYDKCPVPPTKLKIPGKLLDLVWEEVQFLDVPRPDPPPPIIRTLLETQAFTLDGRSNVLPVPREALARTGFDFNDPAASLAIGLRYLLLTELGRRGEFEIEVWLAPEARLVERDELQGAVQIGSLGTFSLGHATHHGAHGDAPSAVFQLNSEARRHLGGSATPGVVFVRRGLVDRRGVQLPFDATAPLFDVGGLMIGTTR